MRGKRARALARVVGYSRKRGSNSGIFRRPYKQFQSAVRQFLELDEEATKLMGEPRLRLTTQPRFTIMHNDGARAAYKFAKKRYTKGDLK